MDDNMKTVYLMFGLPGSGKSTKVQEISKNSLVFSIHSTDDYWIRPDGYYDWNPARIKEAHEWNFREYSHSVEGNYGYLIDTIIVDNTNLRFGDAKRYIDKATAEGYTVVLVEPETPWRYDAEECAVRNVHRVPLETIKKMLVTLVENKPLILKYIEEQNAKCTKVAN